MSQPVPRPSIRRETAKRCWSPTRSNGQPTKPDRFAQLALPRVVVKITDFTAQ